MVAPDLVLVGAVLVAVVVMSVATFLLPESDVNCGICGGTRHWRGGACPRCNDPDPET